MMTIILTWPLLARPSRACHPAVTLVGDPAITAPIAGSLHDRGIDRPEQGCPAEVAEVVQREASILVLIVDADGRRTERQVVDLATATTLIESFAPPPTVTSRRFPDGTAAVILDPEQPTALQVRSAGLGDRRVLQGALGVGLETSLASDRSLWFGVRAHGCVQLAAVCLGADARFARDAAVSGDARRTSSTRMSADVLLVLDLPLVVRGVEIAPGVGLGVGWLRGRGNTEVGIETVDVDAGGVRSDLHMSGRITMTSGLALTLGVAVDLAPFAHVAPYGDGSRAIAGEPRGFVRFGIGIEGGRR